MLVIVTDVSGRPTPPPIKKRNKVSDTDAAVKVSESG